MKFIKLRVKNSKIKIKKLIRVLVIASWLTKSPLVDQNHQQKQNTLVVQNQFYSLDDLKSSNQIFRTGNDTLLVIQPKVNHTAEVKEAIEPFNNSSSKVDDQQVILAEAYNTPVISPRRRSGPSGPSHFPTSGQRPSHPVRGRNPYRIPPKVNDHALGASANPAGAGGGDFDDQCPAPQKEQAQSSETYYFDSSGYPQKKKTQPDEQCELEDNLSNITEFGPIRQGSVVPVESLLGISSGFKKH